MFVSLTVEQISLLQIGQPLGYLVPDGNLSVPVKFKRRLPNGNAYVQDGAAKGWDGHFEVAYDRLSWRKPH